MSGSGWIVKPVPRSHARIRLFCVPYAGGNAGIFDEWASMLPDDIEVCAVQPPGRQQRFAEPPITRTGILAQQLEHAIADHVDLPFALFGSCTGSIVAFEVARRLLRRGRPMPVRLIASSCRAPHLPDRDAPLHQLDDDSMAAGIAALGGTEAEILDHPELRTLLLGVARADFEAAETYAWRPGEPLGVPITVFGGDRDDFVSGAELTAWAEVTSRGCDVEVLAGGHYLVAEAATALLRRITEVLRADLVGAPASPPVVP